MIPRGQVSTIKIKNQNSATEYFQHETKTQKKTRTEIRLRFRLSEHNKFLLYIKGLREGHNEELGQDERSITRCSSRSANGICFHSNELPFRITDFLNMNF